MNYDEFVGTPLTLLEVWNGGLAWYGGLILVLVFLAMTLAVGAVIAIASVSLRESMPGWLINAIILAKMPGDTKVTPLDACSIS